MPGVDEPILICTGAAPALGFHAWAGPTRVHSDAALPGFLAASALPLPPQLSASDAATPAQMNAQGWFADQLREVHGQTGERRVELRVPGLLALALDDDSVLRFLEPPVTSALAMEAMLGVGLTLALAARNCFCLHAAAVSDARGGAWLLLGASGAGKSTMARTLDGCDDLRRLTDDITPCLLDRGEIRAYPRFPQLKLDLSNWTQADSDHAIGLRGLVQLRRVAADQPAALRRLDHARSNLMVLAHTAGSRLFRPRTLSAHLSFAAALASTVPAYELQVPHRPDALAAVAADVAIALRAEPST